MSATETNTPKGAEPHIQPDDDMMPPSPDRPIVRLVDADFHINVKRVEQILSPVVYAQGNVLVRIGYPRDLPADVDIERQPEQSCIVRVSPDWLLMEAMERASFQVHRSSKSGGDWHETKCPPDIPRTLFNLGHWAHFKPLKALTTSPFLRADGSICDKPGYDNESKVMLSPTVEFPPTPEVRDLEDAQLLAGILLDPFAEFPFATPEARSAFLANILTEVGRLAIDCAPMFWYTAPKARTGKSLLSDAPSLITHGVRPARRQWIKDGEELRKQLFSTLLAGDRSLIFDNIPRGAKIRSDVLNMFLTADVYSDRLLGKSESPRVFNSATVCASGNNVTPTGDLAERSIVIRLNPHATRAQLRERSFKIRDLRNYIAGHRVELLSAALAILRAHVMSGHVASLQPLPGFEQWSRVVRDAVIWLGLPNPCDTQQDETESDESEELDTAFKLLAQAFGSREFAAGDVSRLLGGMLDADGKLAGALRSTGCTDLSNVGYWLRDKRDDIAGGYELIAVTAGGKSRVSNKWRMQLVPSGPNADLA